MSVRKPSSRPPEATFPPEEGPTDDDVLVQREIPIDPVTIFSPGEQSAAERGLSIEPEELGRVFLRDALQQQNFESEAPVGFQPDELDLEGVDWDAKTDPDLDRPPESLSFRERTDLDLSADVIHDASLFDQPTDDDEDGTRSPRIRADDSAPPRVPERAARARR